MKSKISKIKFPDVSILFGLMFLSRGLFSQSDSLRLKLFYKNNHFYYQIENNSNSKVLFNLFSGDNNKNFHIVFYNSNIEMIDSCPIIKYYPHDYLYKKINYKYVQPMSTLKVRPKIRDCDILERVKFSSKGNFNKVVLNYHFYKTGYSNYKNSKLIKDSWEGHLVSDTLVFDGKTWVTQY